MLHRLGGFMFLESYLISVCPEMLSKPHLRRCYRSSMKLLPSLFARYSSMRGNFEFTAVVIETDFTIPEEYRR